jgi:RHS repeat-associated protein
MAATVATGASTVKPQETQAPRETAFLAGEATVSGEGWYNYGYRDYSPMAMRFTTSDPIRSGSNWYAYVGGDPVNYVDPWGLAPRYDDGGGRSGCPNASDSAVANNGLLAVATAIALAEPTPAGEAILAIAVGATALASAASDVTVDPGAAPPPSVQTTLITVITQIQINAAVNAAVNAAAESPEVKPGDVAGKTPEEIDRLAKEKGLTPKGPDPKSGEGSYVDPVTGEQRILTHPNANPPHAHVNDPSGQRLDINGNPVDPASPEAHLPITVP